MDQSFADRFRDKFKSKLVNDLSTSNLIAKDVEDKGNDEQNKEPAWFVERRSRIHKVNQFASIDSDIRRVRNASQQKMNQFLAELESSTSMQDADVKLAEKHLETELNFFVNPFQSNHRPKTVVPVSDAIRSRYEQMNQTESVWLHYPIKQKRLVRIQTDAHENEDRQSDNVMCRIIVATDPSVSPSTEEDEEEDILGLKNVKWLTNFNLPHFIPKTQIIKSLQLNCDIQTKHVNKIFHAKQTSDNLLEKNQIRLKELVQKYEQYNLSSEIEQLNHYISELNEQIQGLENELNELSNTKHESDASNSNGSDILLHEKALQLKHCVQQAFQSALKRQLLVIGRRKNLLSILNTWKLVQEAQRNRLDGSIKNDSEPNTTLIVSMDERMPDNEEEEQSQLDNLIKQHVNLEMLIQRLGSGEREGVKFKWLNRLARLNRGDHLPPNKSEDQLRNEIKAQTFLLDGRLPGEPIFTNIRLEDNEVKQTTDPLMMSISEMNKLNYDGVTLNPETKLSHDQLKMFSDSNIIELDERQKTLKLRSLNEIEPVRIPLYDREMSLTRAWQSKSDQDETADELNLQDGALKQKSNDCVAALENRLIQNRKMRNQMQTEFGNFSTKNRYFRYEDLVNEPVESIQSTFNLSRFFASKWGRRPLQVKARPGQTDRRSSVTAFGQLKRTPPLAPDQPQWMHIRVRQAFNVPARFRSSSSTQSNPMLVSWPTVATNVTTMMSTLSQFGPKGIAAQSSNDLNTLDALQVRPFVEFTFRQAQLRSRSAHGTSPSWNESLAFALGCHHLEADESLCINLFDQVNSESNSISGDNPQWLAAVRIPLMSLLTAGRIEGSFALYTNPLQLRHISHDNQLRPLPMSRSIASTGGVDFVIPPLILNQNESAVRCEISLAIRLDPRSAAPFPDTSLSSSHDSIEPPLLIDFARRWQQQQQERLPNRLVRSISLVLPDRKWTLCCRFLSPLRPPDTLLQDLPPGVNQMHELLCKVSRFTASIGRRVDAHQLAWANCEEVIRLNLASEQERAILLCCYFMYLGRSAAVALGSDCSAGSAGAFVLVWNSTKSRSQWPVAAKASDTVQLWHPNTGMCFVLNQSRQLPAVALHTIFTSDNVYANVQKSDQPLQMQFDLNVEADWKPLLMPHMSTKASTDDLSRMKSLQPTLIRYTAPDPHFIAKLEAQLESNLKEKLMSCRRQHPTFFNRDLGRKAKQWLVLMESYTSHRMALESTADVALSQAPSLGSDSGNSPASPVQLARMHWSQMLDGYEVRDMIHHESLDQLPALVESLFASGLHRIEQKQTDFVLAIHLHAYTDQIVVIWLYFAALQRKDHL